MLNLGDQRLAPNGYTLDSLEEYIQAYLMQFASIRVGDIILIPVDKDVGDIHFGLVVLRDLETRQVTCLRPGIKAYYYYHDIPNGDWYECAHRVDVLWDRSPDGSYAIHPIDGIVWRKAFSKVIKSRNQVSDLAKEIGFPVISK